MADTTAGFTAPHKLRPNAPAFEAAFFVPKHVDAPIPSGSMATQFDVYASQESYEAGDTPVDGFGCTVPLSSPAALLGAVFGDMVAFVKSGGIAQIAPDAKVVAG